MLLPGQSELIEITQALIIHKNFVFPCEPWCVMNSYQVMNPIFCNQDDMQCACNWITNLLIRLFMYPRSALNIAMLTPDRWCRNFLIFAWILYFFLSWIYLHWLRNETWITLWLFFLFNSDLFLQKTKQRYNSPRTLSTRLDLSLISQEMKLRPPYAIREEDIYVGIQGGYYNNGNVTHAAAKNVYRPPGKSALLVCYYVLNIQCGAVVTRSLFSQIFIKDTPYLAH